MVTAMLEATGVRAPRLCLVPTGDESDSAFVDAAQRAFAGSAVEVSCLRLFPMPNVADPADLLCSSDAVFVAGGSVANMLAVWRVHAIDAALRAAWEAGVVLGGTSAGAICWFEAGLTDSFGPQLRAWREGLEFLSGSFCPHYDREPRRSRYREEVSAGRLPAGLACGERRDGPLRGRSAARGPRRDRRRPRRPGEPERARRGGRGRDRPPPPRHLIGAAMATSSARLRSGPSTAGGTGRKEVTASTA